MAQAKQMGIDAGEGIALYAECLRGLVFSPNGLLKLVYEKSTGRVVGVHICGDDACELIHYGMELVDRGTADKRPAIAAAHAPNESGCVPDWNGSVDVITGQHGAEGP